MKTSRKLAWIAGAVLLLSGSCTCGGLYLGYRLWYTPPVFALEQDAKVTRVVDGDTVVISIGGQEAKIRLMGMDTPETVDPRKPEQCFGEQAKEETQRLTGQHVRVEFIPLEWPPVTRDRYNRVLAYIFTEKEGNFNEYLVRKGYAHEYTFKGHYKYQDEFRSAQADAKLNKRGMWEENACQLESARPKR
jgi:micrococcal nuclease